MNGNISFIMKLDNKKNLCNGFLKCGQEKLQRALKGETLCSPSIHKGRKKGYLTGGFANHQGSRNSTDKKSGNRAGFGPDFLLFRAQ